MKRLIFSTVVIALLVACSSGGGGGGGPDPVVDLSLDGIYRGSPVVVSARDFTYDYEFETPNAGRTYGTTGRIYTTTVHGNDVSGTATIYGLGGEISTAALTGSITPGGAMSLQFQDGSTGAVNVDVQRLGGQSKTLLGRAWCTYEYDDITVHDCGEFNVVNALTFRTASHGPGPHLDQDIVTLTLGEETTPNVYDADISWEVCRGLSGLVGFAESEDGVYDELVITVSGGNCNFVWFILRATR